jgi:hypothetical protein
MKKILASTAIAASSLGLLAAPADAQPRQEGLVNVFIDNTTVQVPIAVAANVCDVTVGVLSGLMLDDAAPCDADGNATADAPEGTAARPDQSGLVNLTLTDTTVQIPIGIAANVCDVSAAVLAGPFFDDSDTCTAVADPVAG